MIAAVIVAYLLEPSGLVQALNIYLLCTRRKEELGVVLNVWPPREVRKLLLGGGLLMIFDVCNEIDEGCKMM